VLNVTHGWLLIVYLLVVGLAVASPVALAPLVLAESLGLKRFGTLYGWIQLASTLGLFAGPLIAGELYDLTHSYVASFETAALIALSGAVASFFCTAPRRAGIAFPAAVHGTAK
jgi:MFS family permease